MDVLLPVLIGIAFVLATFWVANRLTRRRRYRKSVPNRRNDDTDTMFFGEFFGDQAATDVRPDSYIADHKGGGDGFWSGFGNSDGWGGSDFSSPD